MIFEIRTNIGNFNKLNDVLHFMKDEDISEIEITRFLLWSGENLDILCGKFSFAELKQAVMKSVLAA